MKTLLLRSKYLLASFLFAGMLSVSLFAPSALAQNPTTPTGGGGSGCSNASFLGFPAWYRGLTTGDSCADIKSPNDVGGIGNFIWTIALNLIEILLRLAGFAAVAFIIYGGYKYMISAGSPDGMVAARKTILNAVIGLAISIAAVAIVRTISIGIGLGGQ